MNKASVAAGSSMTVVDGAGAPEALHMTAATQVRHRHNGGRAYLDRKVA